MAIDIATLGLEFDTSGVRRGVKDLKDAEVQGKRTADALGDAGKVGKSGLDSITNGITTLKGALATLGVATIIQQVVAINDEYTRLEGRLGLVTKSTEELVAVQQQLFDLAQESRQPYEAVAGLYADIAAAGAELNATQSEMLKVTGAVGGSLVVAGRSASEAAGAIFQLGQLFGGPIVQAQEYNALIDNMRPLLAAAAKEIEGTGGTVAGLTKLVKAGKLETTTFFQGIVAGADEISSAAQGMERTVGQSLVQLRNEFRKSIAEADTGGLVDAIDALKESITDPSFQSSLVSLVQLLVDTTAVAGQLVPAIDNLTKVLLGLGALRIAQSALEIVAAYREQAAATVLATQATIQKAAAEAQSAASANIAATASLRVVQANFELVSSEALVNQQLLLRAEWDYAVAQAEFAKAAAVTRSAQANYTAMAGAYEQARAEVILTAALENQIGPATALQVAEANLTRAQAAAAATADAAIAASTGLAAAQVRQAEAAALAAGSQKALDLAMLGGAASSAKLMTATNALNGAFALLVGYQVGSYLYEEFRVVQVAGNGMVQAFMELVEAGRYVADFLAAPFNADSIEDAYARYQERAAGMRAEFASQRETIMAASDALVPYRAGLDGAASAAGNAGAGAANFGEEIEKTIKSLREQAAMVGAVTELQKVRIQIELGAFGKISDAKRAELEGAARLLDAGRARLKSIEDQKKAAEELIDTQVVLNRETRIYQLMLSGMSREQAVFEADIEAARRLGGELGRLNEEIIRTRRSQDELADASAESARKVEQSAEQMARAYERVASGIEGVFRDLYKSAFRGFEGFGDQLLDSFENLLVDMAMAATRNQIIIPIVTQIGGAMGLPSDMLGGITNALNLGGQSGLGAFFSMGGEQLGEHALSVMEAEFPGIGATMGANAGASFMASLGPIMGGAAGVAGLYAAGGALTTSGSAINSDIQGIAAVLSGGMSLMLSGFDKAVGGNLFGTKWKTTGQTLAINIQDEIADATLTTVRSRKRALGGGRKRRTSVDGVTELDEQISEVFGTIYDSVTGALSDIGIELGEFEFDISLDTKGKTEEEIQELISGAITSATEALMTQAIPRLEEFQQVGEELADTFDRVVKGASAVRRAIDLFDLNTMVDGMVTQHRMVFEFNEQLGTWIVRYEEFTEQVQASPEHILAAANALTELAGGAEQLQANINAFFNAFATDSQKFDASSRVVKNVFGELGMAVPASSEDLFELVSGLDLFTEAGREAFHAITAATPALQEFYGTLEGIKETAYDIRTRLGRNDGLDPLRDALKDVGLTLEQFERAAGMNHPLARIRMMLDRLSDADLASLGPFIDQILGLVDGTTQSNNSGAISAAQSELMAAFERESQLLERAADSFGKIVDDLSKLQDDLRYGDLARLTPQNQYAADRRRFNETAALARTGDEEALAALPQIARQFLESSQANFATSTKYFADLAMVTDAVGDARGAAQFEVDTAQRQLELMTEQVGQFVNLNQNVISLKQAMDRLVELQGGDQAKTQKEQNSKNLAMLTNSQVEMNKRLDQRVGRIEQSVADLAKSARLESARR